MGKAKKPIAEVGDRIIVPGSVGILEAIIPGKKPKYQVKWQNAQTGFYSEFELKTISYQIEKVKAPAQPDNFPRDWEIGIACFCVGDHVRVTNPNTPESVTAHEWIVDGFTTASSLNGELSLVIIKREVEPKGFTTRTFEPQWLCKVSELVDSSRESADFPEQLNLLEGLTGESQLNETKMRSQSLKATLTTESLPSISETSTHAGENMTSVSADFLVQTHQEPETELELLTYLQSLGQCSENSSESLEKLNPSSCFWNSLRDLSIEDLERGWEDSNWEGTKASIQSSRQRMNSARTLRGKDYLSFPTLLAGHGGKHRDVGLTECEKWWKVNVIQEIGSQLSSEAIASLHGFPANWFRSISPPSVAPLDIQDDSEPENLEDKPSPSHKPELPSNVSSESGQNSAKCLGCEQQLLNLADGCGICGWMPDRALVRKEKSLGKSQTHTERESKQVGSLYQYTSNKKGKDGIIREYPIIEGRERDRANDDDWYWGISYIETLNGKRCDSPRGTARRVDRSASIPRKSLPLARVMMSSGFLYSATIEVAQYKFCWLDFQENWVMGEIRPEICPSLFLCSLKEKKFLIIPSSEWGELRIEPRAAKRQVINEAIANNQSIAQIKEMLNNAERVPKAQLRASEPARKS